VDTVGISASSAKPKRTIIARPARALRTMPSPVARSNFQITRMNREGERGA
jgi:hypothetical protein